MKLSICLPTYNREKKATFQLKELIKQLSTLQNHHEIEILVSDNCSNDYTFEKLMSIKESFGSDLIIKIFRQNLNLGLVGNLGYLYNIASGKYIWFISDDDILYENTIKKIIELIDTFSNRNFYLLNFSTENNNIINKAPYFPEDTQDYYTLINDNTWGGFGLLSVQVLQKDKFSEIFSNTELMKNLCMPVTVSFYGLFHLNGYLDLKNKYVVHHVGDYSWQPQAIKVFSIFLFDAITELKNLGLDINIYKIIKNRLIEMNNFRISSIKYTIKNLDIAYIRKLKNEKLLYSLILRTIKK